MIINAVENCASFTVHMPFLNIILHDNSSKLIKIKSYNILINSVST